MASSSTQNVILGNQEIATIYLPVEELTGIFTRQLIEKSGITSPEYDRDKNPLVVYDNACGIGIFSAQLMELLSPTARIQLSLTCGDTAAPIVNSVRERILDLGSRNATARVIDTQASGLPSAHYTHVYTAFGIMFMPNPSVMLDECHGVLRHGSGVCASST